ncbi:MAG: aldo/keto reductase [Pseudomonadota bacterium]
MNRRDFIKTTAATSALGLVGTAHSNSSKTAAIATRAIPSSGEPLPIIGLGTWQTFDVGSNNTARTALKPVLTNMVAAGATVVDSSPMYGSSETVVGDLAAELGLTDKLFMATKVWTTGENAGIRQMEQSMQKMRAPKMDLMQVHNLLDVETHLKTLAAWKREGRVRYGGLTHYHSGGYADMKRLMLNHDIDFMQINYSMFSREAEEELLPLAADRGIATLINRPFEAGRAFQHFRGKELPEWAGEFDCHSWGQFALKFILSNPAVTCVIPGTSKVKHMLDNLQAGRGKLPSAEHRKRMLALIS